MPCVVLPVMPPELTKLRGINSLILAARGALMARFWPPRYRPTCGLDGGLVALRYLSSAGNLLAGDHNWGSGPRPAVRRAA